jgi:hypothetical protein
MPEDSNTQVVSLNSFPVSRDTDPKKLAGAIAKSFADGRDVTISAIGPAATHRMVLAGCVLTEWGNRALASLSYEETDSGTKIVMSYKAQQA